MPVAHRLRRALLLTCVAVAAIAGVPGAALAADPPTILTAGFDVHDQLYATWSLAPGTTYEQVEFATLPAVDPDNREFFLGGFADYGWCDHASCRGNTAYTGGYPLKRDRRYFVKVNANAGHKSLSSAVWVIDETKPVNPGDAPLGNGDSNAPVAGKPFDGTSLIPPGIVPSVSFNVLRTPKTIGGLLRNGMSVRVTSSVAFAVYASLRAPGKIVGGRSVGYAAGGTHKVTAQVEFGRATLRRRKRARVTLGILITLADGTQKTARRTFTVRR